MFHLLIVVLTLPLLVSSLRFFQQSLATKHRSTSLYAQEIRSINDEAKRSIITGSKITFLAGAVSILNAQRAVAAEYSFLKEPTKEFQDEEKIVAEFNQKQAKIRQDWDAIIEKLTVTEDSVEIAAIITSMTAFLKKIESIPRGVKKTELVKLCRMKKFEKGGKKLDKVKPVWTVPCEVAYQAFIQEFNKQVLPNNKVANTVF